MTTTPDPAATVFYEAAPAAVAVDTIDGYTFFRGADGELFTVDTALAFAALRNKTLKVPTYKVFTLLPAGAADPGKAGYELSAGYELAREEVRQAVAGRDPEEAALAVGEWLDAEDGASALRSTLA